MLINLESYWITHSKRRKWSCIIWLIKESTWDCSLNSKIEWWWIEMMKTIIYLLIFSCMSTSMQPWIIATRPFYSLLYLTIISFLSTFQLLSTFDHFHSILYDLQSYQFEFILHLYLEQEAFQALLDLSVAVAALLQVFQEL